MFEGGDNSSLYWGCRLCCCQVLSGQRPAHSCQSQLGRCPGSIFGTPGSTSRSLLGASAFYQPRILFKQRSIRASRPGGLHLQGHQSVSLSGFRWRICHPLVLPSFLPAVLSSCLQERADQMAEGHICGHGLSQLKSWAAKAVNSSHKFFFCSSTPLLMYPAAKHEQGLPCADPWPCLRELWDLAADVMLNDPLLMPPLATGLTVIVLSQACSNSGD